MTLTTPESTLLSNIKLYLAKADTDLSEEGIKSLVKLTQFNTIVQRIARVAPDSLEKVIFVALDVLQAYKERQKDEKKKRALETKEADGKDLPMIKRRKLVTPDVERGRRSTNTPTVQTTDSANKASDLIKSKNSLVQNKAKTDASNNNHTLSATSHLSPEASTASTSSSVSLSPSTVSSIQSVMSTRPSAIGSTSFRDTENQSQIPVPSPTRSDDFHDTEKQPQIRVSNPTRSDDFHNTEKQSQICVSSPTRSDDFHDTEKQSQIRVSNPIRSDDTQASRKPEQRTTTTALNDPMNQAERQIHQLPLQHFSSSNNDLHLLAIENPEIAIFSEDKETLQQLRSHFEEELHPGFSRSIKATKSDKDISEVLGLCPMLNFDRVQSDLLAFIILRRQRPGSRAHIIDLGENAEPVEIFQAINISGVNEADAKLHRVYGQIRLVESIDRKVKSGYVPMSHTNVNDIKQAQLPTFYLDDMAYEMCRGQSLDARKKLENKLQREREAGMHWIEMIGSMGGMGIVFVLIFAGRSKAVSHNSHSATSRLMCER